MAESDETMPAAQAAEDPWIGREIDGRYVITERLGEGGMGAVFAAEHKQLKKPVALKVILSQFAGNDEIAARFAREAMASAHIEHPNVCATLDYGALPEGGAYLVMQLVRGPSLRAYLRARGTLPWREACEITAQISDAICAAHAVGIIHRDLKPENVIVIVNELGPPTAKVLDFGIAHVKAHNQAPPELGAGLTRAGMIIGTPGYMPPEQATGQTVEESADLYALGVILWELLMGRPPFEAESFSEIVMSQLKETPPPLTLPPDATRPEALGALVHRLLAPSPIARPSSAAEVRSALRALTAASSAFSVQPTVAASWVPRDGEAVSLAPTLARTRERIAGRTRWALLAVVVLFLGGIFAWRHQRAAPAAAAAQTAAPARPPAAPVQAESEKPKTSPKTPEPQAVAPSEPIEPSDEVETSSARKSASRRKSARRSDRPRPVQRIKRALNDLLK